MPMEPSDGPASPRFNGFGPRRRSITRLGSTLAVVLIVVGMLQIAHPRWLQPSHLGPNGTIHLGGHRADQRYPYLGETRGSNDGILITPLSVSYTPGDRGTLANKGYLFAIVTLRIQNARAGDYAFLPAVNCLVQVSCNFYIRDSFGEKNPPVLYDPQHTGLRGVVLQPHGQQVGSYTFEVPKSDVQNGSLQLLWYPNPVSDANFLVHWWLIDRRLR